MRRRFARYLFTVLCSTSLLLCIGVCGLWVRSYLRADLAGRIDGSGMFCFGSYRGHLLCFSSGHGRDDLSDVEYGHDSYSMSDAADTWEAIQTAAAWRVAGFSYSFDAQQAGHVLVAPSWAVALATAWWPVARFRAWRRRRRRHRTGACASCGYDLRAHREGERCPECGTAVPTATSLT
jgi:hypothetical protein